MPHFETHPFCMTKYGIVLSSPLLINPLTALAFFFPNDMPTHYAYIYAPCKKGFQLIMHIYMHTFHYFMFSWGYCKFYVVFQ